MRGKEGKGERERGIACKHRSPGTCRQRTSPESPHFRFKTNGRAGVKTNEGGRGGERIERDSEAERMGQLNNAWPELFSENIYQCGIRTM